MNDQQNKQDAMPNQIERRDFLKMGAIAATVVAPGVMLYGIANSRPPEQGASSKVRWGMLIDTTKCEIGRASCRERVS
jgi:molybdopterin-containing oxidoreductase family iron-sulfur binding subunit